MSGHSRWSQIKRKKGKTDVQRGKLFSKILREITVAARNGGGDPKINMRLKAAMESAKEANMPHENIKRAIQKGTGELPGESYEEITYEGYASGGRGGDGARAHRQPEPHGPRDPAHLREARRQHGRVRRRGVDVRAAGASSWWMPTRSARTTCWRRALEAGATDMRRGEKAFEITTAPAEMDAVREALEAASVPVLEAEVTFVPQSTVRVEGKDAPQVLRLVEALEELDDVQTVYANFDIPDEVIEAISAA